MPRVSVPLTEISRVGVAPATETAGDATNNHTVSNDGRVMLLARNSNAASTARTLTVRVAATVDGQAVTSRTYPIAAAASLYLGPWPVAQYGADLLVDVDHAELKLSAYHLP